MIMKYQYYIIIWKWVNFLINFLFYFTNKILQLKKLLNSNNEYPKKDDKKQKKNSEPHSKMILEK